MGFFKDIVCTGAVRCLSKVIAPEFVGKLTGTADKATTLEGLTSTVTELNYVDGVTSNVQNQIDSLKKSVSDGKAAVASAITGKGVSTAADASVSTMVTNIGNIATLSAETADATVAAGEMLSGKTAYVKGSKVTGTMTNNGAVSPSGLNCGGSYTIPAGYHNGSGKVTANSLASQTSATAAAGEMLSGKTAYVKGSKVTGTMTNNGAKTASLNCGDSYTIPAGYHNGSGKVSVNSLASQTSATATADMIVKGYTGYVKGSKITGALGTYTSSVSKATASSLTADRWCLASANTYDYVLFAGGYGTSGCNATVNAYLYDDLARSTTMSLTPARESLAGATVGNGQYALFAGGVNNGTKYATVDVYDEYLSRTTSLSLSQARMALASASGQQNAIFAGGLGGSGTTVDAYDNNLTGSTPTSLSQARGYLAGATVGNYALFAGGSDGGDYATVDAYDMDTLVRTIPTSLSQARGYLAGASAGQYALFAGGSTDYGENAVSTVDAYNSSLVRSTPTALSAARSNLAGASMYKSDDWSAAMFAGGYDSNTDPLSTIDVYNSKLTRSTDNTLSVARFDLVGGSIGTRVLFAGGNDGLDPCADVDAFKVSEQSCITIPMTIFRSENGSWVKQ